MHQLFLVSRAGADANYGSWLLCRLVLCRCGGGSVQPAAQGKHGQVRPDDSHAAKAATQITIMCRPDAPALAALASSQLIAASGAASVDVREFYHSSVRKLGVQPDKDKLQAEREKVLGTGMVINLMWKDVPSPTMVVSPVAHIPIQGDGNIAKYLCRAWGSGLYPADDFVASTKIDSVLDASARLAGKAKEQKAVLKDINTGLGKALYVCGDVLTVADIVLWAAIKRYEPASPPKNIKEWMKRLDEDPAFVGAVGFSSA